MTQTPLLTTQQFDLFCFQVGSTIFAVSPDQVIEQVGHRQTAPSNPEWPTWANRTMRFRDQDIPVVNLRLRLGLSDPLKAAIIFVIDALGQAIGIAVDKVRGIYPVPINTPITGVPNTLSDTEKDCVTNGLIIPALPSRPILCICIKEFLHPLISAEMACLGCRGIGA